MYQKYVVEKLSIAKIAEISGFGDSAVHRWLHKLEIPVRVPWAFSVGRTLSEESKNKLREKRLGDKNPFYGKKHSPETIERLRECSTGRKHTAEELKKMSDALKGEKNPQYGKKQSEESNRKRREALIGPKNRNYGKHLTDEQKKKIGDFHRGKTISSEQKEKMSKALKGKQLGPKNPRWGKPPMPAKRGAWYFNKNTGRNVWLRSSYEVIAAKRLDYLGIKWIHEPQRFYLEDRTYLPDFYLPEEGVYWEIKGWFTPHAQETIRQFRQLNPDCPLVVIGKPIIRGWLKCQEIA